jgi:hypothetical protein
MTLTADRSTRGPAGLLSAEDQTAPSIPDGGTVGNLPPAPRRQIVPGHAAAVLLVRRCWTDPAGDDAVTASDPAGPGR